MYIIRFYLQSKLRTFYQKLKKLQLAFKFEIMY